MTMDFLGSTAGSMERVIKYIVYILPRPKFPDIKIIKYRRSPSTTTTTSFSPKHISNHSCRNRHYCRQRSILDSRASIKHASTKVILYRPTAARTGPAEHLTILLSTTVRCIVGTCTVSHIVSGVPWCYVPSSGCRLEIN